MSLPFLQSLGLTQNESNLYELLLRLGEVSIAALLKEATMKRPTAYKALYSLEKKGLVTKRDFNKKLYFRPEPPTKLLSLAESQYNELDRAKKNLQGVLPILTSAYVLSVEKPIVSIFEGVNGMKEIYEDTLIEAKPIYALLQPGAQEDELHTWLEQNYVKRRAKLKIPAFVIAATSGHTKEYLRRNEKEFRTVKIINSEQFPFRHEINIYGDKIALLHHRKGEPLIGVVIKHPGIYQTMKAWFDVTWTGIDALNSGTKTASTRNTKEE